MTEIQLRKPNRLTRWLKLYRLYLQAFPPTERKPFGIIVKMYHNGKTDVWCVERRGKFVGLAATINGDDLILLDYFAVDKKQRGQGVGTAALQELQRMYSGKGLFVEIESTRENAANRIERNRRKQFYLSAGLEELNVSAKLFGVNMELLGSGCHLTFDLYKSFYREHYHEWAADRIEPI